MCLEELETEAVMVKGCFQEEMEAIEAACMSQHCTAEQLEAMGGQFRPRRQSYVSLWLRGNVPHDILNHLDIPYHHHHNLSQNSPLM